MAKYLLNGLICLCLVLCLNFIRATNLECPSSKIKTCSPVCYRDSDCASKGGKCCPNLCNQNSCAAQHMLVNGGSADKYGTKPDKYGSRSIKCGNVQCGPFEKCEMDRTTKREKCVRG